MKKYGKIPDREGADAERNAMDVGLLLPLKVSQSTLESERMIAHVQAHAKVTKAPEKMDRKDHTKEVT